MAENVFENAKRELVDSIPKAVMYALTGFVIWLFTKAIFVPLGQGIVFYGDIKASTVIAAVSIITILVIILKVLKELRDVCDALADVIALSVDPKAAPTEHEVYRKVLKSLSYVILVAVGFLFFGSLLNEIHPAISGIILVIIFLWAIVSLYSAGMLMSDKVEAKIKKLTSRIVEPEKTSLTEKK